VTFPAARTRQLTALEAYKVRPCSHICHKSTHFSSLLDPSIGIMKTYIGLKRE